MTEDAFWQLVETAGPTPDRVRAALEGLPDDEVVAFRALLRAQVARANDWGVWAAGYLAHGGMSDDSFLDFRFWLVHQGRAAVDAVLTEPDALAGLSWTDEEFEHAEDLGYVADELLTARGTSVPADGVSLFADPTGEEFPEEDRAWFAEHLPRLWARSGGL